MINIFKLPILLVGIFVAIMFLLDISRIGYKVAILENVILSVVVFVLGLLIIVVGGYSFRKAKTTVNPMTPELSTQLVTAGIYNCSRNPMYIGFLLWLLACAIYIGNVINLLLIPLFIFLVNRLYILPEERALEKLFKEEFRGYKKRVRRWV